MFRQHVFPQGGASVEGFVTDVAAEGLLSGVSPQVFGHVALQLEALPAVMAAVGPLPGVDPHVVLQVALAGDVLATDVTVEVALAVFGFALVHLEVPRQHDLFGEDVVADVAAVQRGGGLFLRQFGIFWRGLLGACALLRCSAVFQLLNGFDQLSGQGVAVVAVFHGRLLLHTAAPQLLPLLLVLFLFDL